MRPGCWRAVGFPTLAFVLTNPLLSAGKFRLFLAFLVVLVHSIGVPFGAVAVYLFFVLSGYWISHMWTRQYASTRSPYLTFLVSRAWRIFPLYWLCYVITILVCLLTDRFGTETWTHVATPEWVARMAVLVSSSGQEHLLRPAWSLDFEMQFYLVAPLVVLVLRRPAAQAVGAVLAVALGAALAAGHPAWPRTAAHYGAFFLGGVLCQRSGWQPGSRLLGISQGLFVVSLGGIVCWSMAHRLGWTTPLVNEVPWRDVAVVLFGFPLAIASCHRTSDQLDRHLGNLAYPLYLIHDSLDILFEQVLHDRGLSWKIASLPLQWALMLGAAVALYVWVDRPIDLRRQRFVASRRPGAELAA